MRFFTLIFLLLMAWGVASQCFVDPIQTVFSAKSDTLSLYGIPVELQTKQEISDILAQYRYDAYPLPKTFLPYLDKIIILSQSSINDEYGELTSGYTKTYFFNDLYTGSVIYLSDTQFQKATLLHEALHVIDAQFQFSNSQSFAQLCQSELDDEYNQRILAYYDQDDVCSEYFVESYINYLYDSEKFHLLQPNTYDFIENAENRINSQ